MWCEEDHEEAEVRLGFLGLAVRTMESWGLSSYVWVERPEHSSASSGLYWTLSTSAVKNKGNKQTHTDESQMSRQGSKKPSRPQRQRIRNTHTPVMTAAAPPKSLGRQREERVPLCREMRICGRLLCSSACLMSVCGTDGEEARMLRRMDRSAPESWRVSMPVPINALTHSSSQAQASALTAGTMENKELTFYDGKFSLMWITLFYFSHCLE